MKHIISICFAVLICFSVAVFGQIPINTLVQIVKAEDERRYDKTLENLLTNRAEKVRSRAVLAIGRIGDENGIPTLTNLFRTDSSNEVKTMAVFALGETESAKATPFIIEILKNRTLSKEIRARALEAAGKIAAANQNDRQTKELGETLLQALDSEDKKRDATNREVALQGLTAVLRARPANGEKVVIDFLGYSDPRMRSDALNTLARLKAKNANDEARELLQKDADAVVRANAARVLGAAEDKGAVDVLLKAATGDADLRVRVSAIGSLAALKDTKVVPSLMAHGEKLLQSYASSKTSVVYPKEKNELLILAATLGRLLQNTDNAQAMSFLNAYGKLEDYRSPEVEIALTRISPKNYGINQKAKDDRVKANWMALSASFQGIGELANAPNTPEINTVKSQAKAVVALYIDKALKANAPEEKVLSDALTAYAAFKTDDLPEVLRKSLQHRDVTVRATVAGLLADTAPSKENFEALKTAFNKAFLADKRENDAQLALLDALSKLHKKESVGIFLIALNAPDYLVRKKAFQILSDKDLQKESPGIPSSLGSALAKKNNQVLPYAANWGTKLGMILNTNADYTRALSRKSAKAVITTSKGTFTINFHPEAAPLTVDNYIKLARSGYFNNVMIHRVVPNFVMQDGDPRGDGNGSPGWEIRCEINMIPYERGAVGMALSGKDTGGSQWFITHSPQPHLDGGYTVFGRVNEEDMKVIDNLVRGDKIMNVHIIEDGRVPSSSRGKK